MLECKLLWIVHGVRKYYKLNIWEGHNNYVHSEEKDEELGESEKKGLMKVVIRCGLHHFYPMYQCYIFYF